MNAVERKPVETRTLNPTASEASYKPKQRSYRITVPAPNCPGAELSRAEMSSAETYPTRGGGSEKRYLGQGQMRN